MYWFIREQWELEAIPSTLHRHMVFVSHSCKVEMEILLSHLQRTRYSLLSVSKNKWRLPIWLVFWEVLITVFWRQRLIRAVTRSNRRLGGREVAKETPDPSSLVYRSAWAWWSRGSWWSRKTPWGLSESGCWTGGWPWRTASSGSADSLPSWCSPHTGHAGKKGRGGKSTHFVNWHGRCWGEERKTVEALAFTHFLPIRRIHVDYLWGDFFLRLYKSRWRFLYDIRVGGRTPVMNETSELLHIINHRARLLFWGI